jgi:hypothetical protein
VLDIMKVGRIQRDKIIGWMIRTSRRFSRDIWVI